MNHLAAHTLRDLDWLLETDAPVPAPKAHVPPRSDYQQLAMEYEVMRTLVLYLYRSVSKGQWDAALARTCQMQEAGEALDEFLGQRTS
jgi:hypothetical protein